jgi:23S rRNA pseudouridine2604 synthase
MTEPERLSRRVAALANCSRNEAEQYIEGGWVSVNGQIIEHPQHKVTDEQVVIDPDARPQPAEPATLLLHKPAGVEATVANNAAAALVSPESRWADDASGVRLLRRHFAHLTPLMPIETEASGLVVLSQDGRVWRRLTEDADSIEQEFVVEVSGQIAPYGLHRLAHGMSYRGKPLPRCKVSWQNEIRLRFAIKSVLPGQLREMCAQVGLEVVGIRRLRIGKIPLGKMAPGQWRYLPAHERF